MLHKESLIDYLASPKYSRRDKILLILATDSSTPLQASTVKKIAIESGLREIEKWNPSSILAQARGFAVKVDKGWRLTGEGLAYVQKSLLAESAISTKASAVSLRIHLDRIKNPDTKSFLHPIFPASFPK